MKIPFNKIYYCEEELKNIKECLTETGISSGNKYSGLCEKWLFNKLGKKNVLTVSCTAALEMAALLSEIKPGDEVIMPSYTFVSTANAFVLRGAVPVFVDIDINTININVNLIEKAITNKTKVIVVVHYAGVACDMDKIMNIARKYNLIVIEDAAHALGAKYNNENLGCIGDIGCFSFHETKNISSGEGGAILINNEKYNNIADVISEKGTNRKSFILGNIDKYTWLNIGSSYRISDICAAVLYPQLKIYSVILEKRLYIWNQYQNFFKMYEKKGYIKCPVIPKYAQHNAHIFYILFNNKTNRDNFIGFMKNCGIDVNFHYVPLHSSPMGKTIGRPGSSMINTNTAADTLVRLPLFYNLTNEQLDYIFSSSSDFFKLKYE